MNTYYIHRDKLQPYYLSLSKENQKDDRLNLQLRGKRSSTSTAFTQSRALQSAVYYALSALERLGVLASALI